MINVAEYIMMLLGKKKWTKTRLCEKLNEVEKKLGDTKTHLPYLNSAFLGENPFRPKLLAKIEVALGLREGTLINMVAPPISPDGKEELRKILEKLRKVR